MDSDLGIKLIFNTSIWSVSVGWRIQGVPRRLRRSGRRRVRIPRTRMMWVRYRKKGWKVDNLVFWIFEISYFFWPFFLSESELRRRNNIIPEEQEHSEVEEERSMTVMDEPICEEPLSYTKVENFTKSWKFYKCRNFLNNKTGKHCFFCFTFWFPTLSHSTSKIKQKAI